ncbi:MAG: acetyl-CoA carboxylase carboxyl transferase subunit alpha, partial [Verrucomicrobiota bacterium]
TDATADGALGIGVADRVLMMENSYYSVISPEGCAAILWKDRKYAQEAAQTLRLCANDLNEMGIVDEVIPEPLGGAHRDLVSASTSLKTAVRKHLLELENVNKEELLEARYQKFRKFGEFKE